MWLSFFINFIFLTYITFNHIVKEKLYSPFISAYIVFNYLFFLVAPLIQLLGMKSEGSNLFPNFFPATTGGVVETNLVILLFHLVFYSCYVYLKKTTFFKKQVKNNFNNDPLISLKVLTFSFLGIVILVLNYDYLILQISESHWRVKKAMDISVSAMLIKKKVLFTLPLAGAVLAVYYLKLKRRVSTNTMIVFIALMVLVLTTLLLKNPLTEKRNAIGPLYIAMIFIFYPKLINTNAKMFVFLFLSLIIAFPLISSLTHLDATFDDIISNPGLLADHYREEGIFDTFKILHYDAFANIMATIDYVSVYGLSFGYQLSSGLLFFIPRSIWVSKPYSTGELIGGYLIDDYGFNYDNLSNPVVSEGYINLGILGVILMAIALGFVVVFFLKWLKSNDPLKKIAAFYFSVHLIFLLRGDFTNGFSYYVGTFIGMYILPLIIGFFVRAMFTKKI